MNVAARHTQARQTTIERVCVKMSEEKGKDLLRSVICAIECSEVKGDLSRTLFPLY